MNGFEYSGLILMFLFIICLLYIVNNTNDGNSHKDKLPSFEYPRPANNLLVTFSLKENNECKECKDGESHIPIKDKAKNLVLYRKHVLNAHKSIKKNRRFVSQNASSKPAVIPTLRFYQTTGCPACKMFKPIWNESKKLFPGFAWIDVICDPLNRDTRCDQILINGNRLQGFPTITFSKEYDPANPNEQLVCMGVRSLADFQQKLKDCIESS